MRLLTISYILTYGSMTVLQAWPQGTTGNILTDETDASINQVLAEWATPGGIAVAVVRRDNQGAWNVETKGYGLATASGTKVTENTRFAIGSNSKLFNILATGLLIHNETLSPRLSWTSKIASIIPSWDLVDSTAAKEATIIDLMSHRTGLPRHDASVKTTDDVPALIKKLKYQRPSAEFREVLQYNNNMYSVLSYLPPLLLKSKISFARYVKQHIFEPLGLNSTTYSYQVANSTGLLADGLLRQGGNLGKNPSDNGTVRVFPFWSTTGGEDGNVVSGPGGVISTAADMATWLQTLLLGGANPKNKESVLPPDIIQKVSTGITVFSGAAQLPELSPIVYGGGQMRGTYRGFEIVEHDGSVPGFRSVISRFPSENLGVAVLSNDDNVGGIISEIVKFSILDEALGLEKVDWNSRYKLLASRLPEPALQRPSNASPPSVGFAALAGTYSNPGYGDFELCLVSSNNTEATKSCKILAAKLPMILPGTVPPNVPTFVAEYGGYIASHIRLTHYNQNIFNVSGLTSYASGNPADPFWVYGDPTPYDGGIHAEVGTDNGHIGFSVTGIWGAGAGIPSPQGKTPQERAEVWFSKLK